MYETGGPGELFITMSKEGSTIGGLMDSLGTAISVALQYGVPIESLVSKFAYQRFEPQGITTNRDIPFAKSLVDYIFQWMGMQFIEGYKEANLPNRAATSTLPNQETIKQPAQTTIVKEDTRWSGQLLSDTVTTPRDSVTTGLGGITPKVNTESAKTETVVVQQTYDHVRMQTSEGELLQIEEMTMQSSLSQSNAKMQGDAPACPSCGAITVRNGTCYKCMNCGESLGCS
jgi:ribonucleoside-diphosphate reductase alpha chain